MTSHRSAAIIGRFFLPLHSKERGERISNLHLEAWGEISFLATCLKSGFYQQMDETRLLIGRGSIFLGIIKSGTLHKKATSL